MSEVFLYIITFSWGSKAIYRTEMPSWDACIAVVEGSRGHVSDGAENEAGVVLFCGGNKLEDRSYGSKWEWVATEVEDE